MTPDTYDLLQALWKRIDNYPEARFDADGGATLKRDAYVAFLEARELIEREVRGHVYAATAGWRPIATFFDFEPEGPLVPLWLPATTDQPGQVVFGYWDDDERAFRTPDGSEDPPSVQPSKFMRLADLAAGAGEDFIAIPRMAD